MPTSFWRRAGRKESPPAKPTLRCFSRRWPICSNGGASAKTHSGVHSRFAAAAKDAPVLGPNMGRFLARSYEHKQDHDYGHAEPLTMIEAQAMLDHAEAFLARIERALEPSTDE
jgi:hypothetical protein